MTQIKAIIFDCDGVLIDMEYAHFASWQKALHDCGIQWNIDDNHIHCGIPGEHMCHILHAQYGLDCPTKLLDLKRHYYELEQKKGIPAITRTKSLIQELLQIKDQLDIKLAVASGARKREIEINLNSIGLQNAFDLVISGYDDLQHIHDPEGVNKPKPYIYLHTAERLGIHPSACIAIEDSHTGITAAHAAGMISIAIPHTYSLLHDFSKASVVIPPDAPLTADVLLGLNCCK